MLRVRAEIWRGRWHLRVRGTDPVSGQNVDTRWPIKPEVFVAARTSATGARAARAAEVFAAQEEMRLNATEHVQQRIAKGRTRMRLEAIWNLYQQKNPNQIKPTSMYRTAKMARALMRCRCEPMTGRRCLAHTDPEHIDLSRAEDYRNLRLAECGVCGAAEHPTSEGKHAFRSVSPRSVYDEEMLLRQLLTFAREREPETGISKTSLHRLPKLLGKRGVREKITPTEEQFFKVYDACGQLEDDAEADRYRRMIGFAFATGLRKTPLSHFRMEWYDRDAQRIHIPADLMKGKGDDYRALDVPICRWAADFLEDLPTSGHAWPNPATGLPQVDFFRVESKLTRLAGLPRKFSLHRLRAGFNSLLINHRCDRHTREIPFHVRELLMGHLIDPQVATYSDFAAVLADALDVVDCAFDAHEKTANKSNVVQLKRRRARAR